MEAKTRTIESYLISSGESPFEQWMDELRGDAIHGRIINRLEKVKRGNLGDWKALGEDANELRVDFGERYRVYFGFDGDKIILLCGGTKKGQSKGIARAKRNWRDYNA